MENSKQTVTPSAQDQRGSLDVAAGSAITPEIGEACARLLMADSRMHALLDSYTNGRLILSALHNRLGCKYPNHDEARRDLIKALGH